MYCCSADHAALMVKASGLAAGKGVVVAADRAGRRQDGVSTDSAGKTVLVEELLTGQEVSVSRQL